jgi:excisionase family DNA binding protein
MSSSPILRALLDELIHDETALDELAAALGPRLGRLRLVESRPDGWLNAEQAAEYLACSRDRLYDLVQIRKLEAQRDGRRLLFRRSDLDAYVAGAGTARPKLRRVA